RARVLIISRRAPNHRDAIVEAGVAMGGSTMFLADVCEMLGEGMVYGVDRDTSQFNPAAAAHPRIELIEGDACAPDVYGTDCLSSPRPGHDSDSRLDHDTPHVLAELRLYADLVMPHCYLVCEDGTLDRPDGPSVSGHAGPSAAIRIFLAERPDF